MEGIPTKILSQGILKPYIYNHKVHVQVACKKFILLLQERASSATLFIFLFV